MQRRSKKRELRCPHGHYYWYPFHCRRCQERGMGILPGGEVVENVRPAHEPPRVVNSDDDSKERT